MDETARTGDLQQTHDFAAQLNAVRADIGELLRAVRLMGQQVNWLMDNALITAEAPISDLDEDIDEAIVALAATVERGEAFRSQLLDGITRSELRQAVDRYADWQRRLDDQYAALVALSTAVVSDDEQTALPAAEEFPAAARAVRDLEREGPPLEAPARDAAQRLEADDDIRSAHSPDIDAVATAWQELYLRLRAVVDEGVAKRSLFPAWFRNSLGLAPSPDQPTLWLELATEVRAYRITYGVVADDSVLGVPPAVDWSRRRVGWYRRLSEGLSRIS